MRYCLASLVLATMFTVCVLCGTTGPKAIVNVLKANALRWAGLPEKVVAVKRVVIRSDMLSLHLLGRRTQASVIPMETIWRHGMVESHGQVASGIMQTICGETPIVGPAQMQVVLLYATLAKN